jgi:heat shock protein HtpX
MGFSIYLKITLLLAVLTGLLMAIGYIVGLYFGDPYFFTLVALALAAVFNFFAYFYSDSLVLRMSGAKLINENDNPTLFSIVRNVSQKAGIPMPRVGVVETQQANAFATGRGPEKGVVVATTGILKTLSPEELEAVIGHEIGHVIHRDVLLSSVAATIAGAISYIGNLAFYSMWFGGVGGRERNNNSGILMLIAAILIPLGATFVQLGISRNAEYNADEYGAKVTRNPLGLIRALEKISYSVSKTPPKQTEGGTPSPATAALWIVNPFKGSSLLELFSTHPSTEHRIERLKKIAREMNIYIP